MPIQSILMQSFFYETHKSLHLLRTHYYRAGSWKNVHVMWHYEACKSTWREDWDNWARILSLSASMQQPENNVINFNQKPEFTFYYALRDKEKPTYLLTVTLREVHHKASNWRQWNQGPSTSMPQLRINTLPFACFQNKQNNLLLSNKTSKVKEE